MKYGKRLEHFLILRLVIALAGFLLDQFWRGSLPEPPAAGLSSFLYAVLSIYLLEAIGALAFVRLVKRPHLFIAIQVAIDLLLVGALVARTGGSGSLFCPLFFACVLAASTVMNLEGSIVCSSSATIILAAASVVPHMLDATHAGNSWRIASYLLTYGLALHGVSILSARLVGSLAEATNLTTDIVETMGEGLIAADRSGRILMFNNEARTLLDIAAEERLEGRTMPSILRNHSRESDKGFEILVHRITSAAESHTKTTLRRANGKPFPVEIKTTVLRGRKGNVRGTVLLLRDLTLRYQIDAAARRIAKLEELTEIARGIAHEVRNPLASMCGCAQEIVQEEGISGQTKRLADILVREAKRVDRIIDDFLSFARIRKLKRQSLDVGELIASVGILLEARLTGEHQRVVVEKPSDPITISGDQDLLTQLLLNVGINALEALEDEEGEVRLSAERQLPPFYQAPGWNPKIEDGVQISVSDTGCGLAESELTKIFNPFYSRKAKQTEPMTGASKTQGTGLGLTIAHRIARIHGGTITVSSESGEGSTFRIWLPGATTQNEKTQCTETVWA